MEKKEPLRVVILENGSGYDLSDLFSALSARGWGVYKPTCTLDDLQRRDPVGQWIDGIALTAAQAGGQRVLVNGSFMGSAILDNSFRQSVGLLEVSEYLTWVLSGWLHARGGLGVYLPIRSHEVGANINSIQVQLASSMSSMKLNLPMYQVSEALCLEFIDQQGPVYLWRDQGFGTLEPGVWMVGYQHNLSTRARASGRFEASFDGGCGSRLYEVIRDAGFTLGEVHVSNAYSDDSTLRDLRQKWEFMQYPAVVALGAEASKALVKHEVPHRRIYHPAYAKRFLHHDLSGYVQSLREAVYEQRGDLGSGTLRNDGGSRGDSVWVDASHL